jgi:hypothetical protein
MALKSRNHFPPGGWMFYQPEIGWKSNPNVGFNDVVAQIISIRQANPRFKLPTDRPAVENELEAYTEARLRSQYGEQADQWLISGAAPPNFPTLPRPRQRGGAVVAAGAKVGRVSAGVGLMIDWLGDGLKPVDQQLAEDRAKVCVRCPHNLPASAIQGAITGAVASGVHKLMEEKAEMKLRTSDDDKLHTCEICGCVMSLKIWAPADHIKKHTPDDVLNRLPAFCWVRREIST